VLVIEEPVVVVRSNHRASWLEPHVLLRETGRQSGATLLEVLVSDRNGGGASIAGSCLQGMRVVAPGGVLDTFYTDGGWDWMSYCAPHVEDPVRVTIDFADEEGRRGRVEARIARQ
jgi:hypothetical protein